MLLKIIELKSSLCLPTKVAQSVHGLGNVINYIIGRRWNISLVSGNFQACSGVHIASCYSKGGGDSSQGKIGTGAKKIIYLHIVPSLRMSGAKLPFPIHLHSSHRNDFTIFMFTTFTNIDFSRRETG
jgi:hypothetical protein